jgi:hypothetical protein
MIGERLMIAGERFREGETQTMIANDFDIWWNDLCKQVHS